MTSFGLRAGWYLLRGSGGSLLGACALLLLASTLRAESEADAKELLKFQGSWKMVSLEDKDKKWDKDELPVVKIVIVGKEMTTHLKDGGTVKSTIKPNGGVDPHELDTTAEGNVFKGIYKFDGDKLIMCSTGVDFPRPKKFDVKETKGSGGVTVYQKIK